MNKPSIQVIFYRFYPAYLDNYTPSYVQVNHTRTGLISRG